MLTRVKGTQDFLDMSLFNFIVDTFKRHVSLYNFTEIKTPLLEPVALFQRSLGEYSDVVSKEMFLIQSEEPICLRPEATAATMRSFIEHNIQSLPWKVYSVGPMFRYERPQKGRYRQFHQINLEIIGSADVSQDALLITMLDRFFHEKLSLNNYALLVNYLGCSDDRKRYEIALRDYLTDNIKNEVCKTCLVRIDKNILRIFDCKNETCKELYKKTPTLIDTLCASCEKEWHTLREELTMLSVSFMPDPRLVRGLDYYNKTAFEFVSSNLGAQNAFCGGGRYDQLAKQLGGSEDQPSIGAAMGIERLLILLEPLKDSLLLPQKKPLSVIIPLSQTQHALALLLVDTLQAADVCTEVLFEGSMKSMMRKANKLGATYVLMLGDEEQKAHTVTIKNMLTSEQLTISQIEAADYLKKSSRSY